ncbi:MULTISPECIES: hypothetical protein [Chroococcidiopsis]|uniref:hypothetical protein n=1 Tax=Chroococcidiopsis TaxID=54298 RepID=UPI000F8CA111|nr:MULTISPECIES: hypothetical protein [Chroococcidiopsis]MBE9015219.1 hypothetical protein [Chroococcidiopsidales cyanobacterium LEGE 13417]
MRKFVKNSKEGESVGAHSCAPVQGSRFVGTGFERRSIALSMILLLNPPVRESGKDLGYRL